MDAEDVIARLRSGYKAFNRGEVEAVLEDLDPGIEVRERPDSPDPVHTSGREDAIAAFRSLHEEFEDYRFEPREFHVLDEHVVVVLRQSGRGRISGVPVEGDIVHAFRIVDDFRISGLRAFSTLDEALAYVGAER